MTRLERILALLGDLLGVIAIFAIPYLFLLIFGGT